MVGLGQCKRGDHFAARHAGEPLLLLRLRAVHDDPLRADAHRRPDQGPEGQRGIAQLLDHLDQSPGHFATGRIIGVHYPRMRVAAFASQRQFAGLFFIEPSAYRQQFAHDLGSFQDHRFGYRPIAKSVSS